ncbi:MAG TPA: hypothetical protein VKB19_15260 [Pedobacter sp.]|nr:hypothetical protein [Pedobacter sp.]
MIKRRLYIQVIYQAEIDDSEFKYYAALASNLLTFHLPKLNVKKTRKILIEFADTKGAFFIFPQGQEESMYTVCETFQFADFFLLDYYGRMNFIIRKSVECLKKLFEKLHLATDIVIFGEQEIYRNNFRLDLELCGGLKINKRRTIKAVVNAEHFLKYTLLQIVFFTANNEEFNRVSLFKTSPSHVIYNQLLDSAKWLNDEVFRVANVSEEFAVEVRADGKCRMIYNPKMREVQDIQEEIKFLTEEFFVS